MNAAQENYAIAKANYETAHQTVREYMQSFDWILDTDDEEMIDLYTEIECNKEDNLNILELRLAVKISEEALLDWARTNVYKVAFLEEHAAIEIAYEAARKNVKIRNQIVNAAMKLS